MRVLHDKKSLQKWVSQEKTTEYSLGFVPTMGALHPGHLSLVKQAQEENQRVISSIFVNPIQFNNPRDLDKYPRNLEKDLEMLEQAGCHAVFCPDEKEMYPQKETRVYDFGALDTVMEGRFRPGHFNGVAIVVQKLFDLIKPHRAYFGEKDFQQLQVIRCLITKEEIPVEVVACPTIREADGLAMSSRNARLTKEARAAAPEIFSALQQARKMYPDTSVNGIIQHFTNTINSNPYLKVEYMQIVWADTLLPVSTPENNREVVACTAVQAGEVRLIDNLRLNT